MKRLTGYLLIATIALFAISCGGSGGGGSKSTSPAAIEKAIFSEFQKGNIEKGLKLFFENCDDANMGDEDSNELKAFAEKVKYSLDERGGIKSFEIINEEFDESGEKAVVTSKITYGNGDVEEERSKYVKVDGKWKATLGK